MAATNISNPSIKLSSVRLFVAAIASLAYLTAALHSAQAEMPPDPSPRLPQYLDEKTQRAIKRGLDYLTRTQRLDNGGWMSAGDQGSYPAVMTSLAGLALLASGSTPTEGPYAKNIRKAMDFLMQNSNPQTGVICAPGEEGRNVYGHGFGMLFLAECYGSERDVETRKKLKTLLEKAVQISAASQSSQGGWYYTLGSREDEGSTTVTQMQGLRAARNAGIKVPQSTIQRAGKYLADCQNPDGGISYSYRSRGSSRPAISAAAVACLYAAGKYEDPMANKCVDYVVKNINPRDLNSGGFGFYTHFYMSQAMYQLHNRHYDKYFPAVRDTLLKAQAADGSWMGESAGTTYGTAIACIILQLPYDYMPIFQR